MKILVVSNNYPSKKTPDHGVFVYNLVQKFCDIGHEVTVISPQKWWHMFKKTSDYGHEKARVFRPKITSYSNIRLGAFYSYKITHYEQVNAIEKTVKKNHIEFDVVYCHFLLNGFIALEALSKYGKPIFTAIGESVLNNNIMMLHQLYGEKGFSLRLSNLDGFVAVSDQLKRELIVLGIPENIILLAPNAVDLERFQKGNRHILRQKYNIPQEKFVLAFLGNLIERKGPLRLMNAIKGLDNVVVLFIGKGPQKPKGPQVVFSRPLPSYLVPELLNCADVFVLPTLSEGSNNAIYEAMACGLPIISSDIPEIRAQCDPSFSLLINPGDIFAIRMAIIKLLDNPKLCESMSKHAIARSKELDINKRAARILRYISDPSYE